MIFQIKRNILLQVLPTYLLNRKGKVFVSAYFQSGICILPPPPCIMPQATYLYNYISDR